MIQISVSELKTNAGKYVGLADQEVVYITKNGRRVAKLVSAKPDKVALAKSLFGIIPADSDLDQSRKERLS